ncbi:MAG: hypothetical protein F4207_11435 [Gemmatimonadetes bacterium]|nr:hypothetical protein [Gemmatimonadota bacterium]MYG17016.1 hypothetical protein [Gemmatimonadota bacterium]MYH18801.1 hypothetical protein [Gemmatimonadota bacterium]MYK98585.1 hypothetical protein [Gemmatimonadota bacterium]
MFLAVTLLGAVLASPTIRLWFSSPESIEALAPEERKALYSQSTVPGFDLAGGYRLSASMDLSRFTERGRARAVEGLVENWRRRLNAFGISEPVITARENDTFEIVVPLSADTGLVSRIIRESGEITLHLFKDGAEVQALRQRIDDALRERALAAEAGAVTVSSAATAGAVGQESELPEEPASAGTGGPASAGPGEFSALLSSITVEEGIGDVAVREDNLDAVKAILADSTVQAGIRAFNLANPPAGAFAWASVPVERGGRLFHPLYFINQDVDLNVQPVASAVVSDASVTANRGVYAVRLFLQDEGRESLANLSSANTGNRVAIKMNGQVYVTLNIQGRIPDGRIEVPGGDSLEEARALAVILESESPPLDVALLDRAADAPSPLSEGAADSAAVAGAIGLGLLCALFVIRYRAAGLLFVTGMLHFLIMTGAVLRLWNIAGIAPYFTLAGAVGLAGAVLIFASVHLWIFEYLRAESGTESSVRQDVMASLVKIRPVLVWTHVMLLLVSVSLVVVGTDAIVNFGLVLFSGAAGSLLTCMCWTNMLLSSLVADWQIRKLSV